MINPILPKKLSTWDRIPIPVKNTTVALYLSFQEILFVFSRINKEMHASQNTMMNRKMPKGCDFTTLVKEINTYNFSGAGMMFLIRAIGSKEKLKCNGDNYDYRELVGKIFNFKALASVELVLASTIDVNFEHNGVTRLIKTVIRMGDVTILQRFIAKGANVSSIGRYLLKGVTPLNLAVSMDAKPMVEVLLKENAQIGRALAFAASLDMVLFLEKHGAEWTKDSLNNIKDRNEQLYMEIVAHPELKERLQKLGLLDQLAEDSL